MQDNIKNSIFCISQAPARTNNPQAPESPCVAISEKERSIFELS